MNPRSLYIHVPFCLRRCSYCDFAVKATREPPVEAWLRAIVSDLRRTAEARGWSAPLALETIYIGGGTPSLLPIGMMPDLREALAPLAVWDERAEWTVEANPETLTAELARDWRSAGVNRLSMGAQTFHEPALKWMGRLHGAEGPARAFGYARDAGIDNVSIDLIFGLPRHLGRDWAADIDRALALAPTHISLYGLTAEPATPLGRWVAEGREQLATEDTYEAEYILAATLLPDAGFEHYEVSNFALPGQASRHNSVYWQHEPYVGIGPGAHSYLPPERSWNVRDWAEYAALAATAGALVTADRETVTGDALALERIWLGLRARPGLPREQLNGAQRQLVEDWTSRGWLHRTPTTVLPTARGWLLLDRLAVELSEAAAGAAVA